MIDMKEMNMLLIRKFVLQISRLTQQLQYVPEHAGFWLKSTLLQHIYSEELCRRYIQVNTGKNDCNWCDSSCFNSI